MALKYNEILKKYNIYDDKKLSLNEIDFIEQLFNDGINIINLNEFENNSNILVFIGIYYKKVEKDYELMKKYYLMAIELGDACAMNNLGLYYEKVEKDYGLMKKYYLMAIELSNSYAMNNLGMYYKNVEKDYELMKKYYLMAIELGNSSAMNNLGWHYEKVEKNYGLMKKYYLMAIELDNSNAMNNLELHFLNNKFVLYKLLLNIDKKNMLVDKVLNKLEKSHIKIKLD